jgi:hypothetical protein
MITSLLTAAVLAVLLAGAHSYLGERYILIRLFRMCSLPQLFGGTEFTRATLRFAWHLTSVAWFGLAGLLVILAAPGRARVADVIALTFGASGLLALVGSRGRHLSWVVFLTISALVWYGSR